ncbi:pyridoxamine 5'-phosphate oxidase family protein [Pedobacter sp. SYSU D00535]|uniref:pyridoxamine 5'-phosphate oxidase family protein n=1 Tax=Pedobacter sp. SYSU D00535 TaxID=2810308 RepID=UPI001A96CFC2|nr:pyridoxamine 5'-phosphate oxidase family protein [Pedobacter sp. SYSU D00535]
MESSHRDSIQKLKDLIHEVDIAMLCTLNGDEVRSRPMATLEIDDEGFIWFFTNEYSGKVGEVEEQHKVNVIYSHPGKQTYVSVNGYAVVVNDRSKMEQLYTPTVNRFFSEGLDDPKLALLKIKPYQAEYWESHAEEGMVRFMGILGSSPVADEELHHSEHGKLNL